MRTLVSVHFSYEKYTGKDGAGLPMGTPGVRQLQPALGQSHRSAGGVCLLLLSVAKVGIHGGWFRACPKKNMGAAFIASETPPSLSKLVMSLSDTGVVSALASDKTLATTARAEETQRRMLFGF